MKKIRLIDGCFPGNPSSIAGDNVWRGPQHFEWCRDDPCDSFTTFYTNWVLTEATQHNSPVKIAWLLEPPSIQEWPYSWVSKAASMFNAILLMINGCLMLVVIVWNSPLTVEAGSIGIYGGCTKRPKTFAWSWVIRKIAKVTNSGTK